MTTNSRTTTEQGKVHSCFKRLLVKLANRACERNTAAFEDYARRALRIAKVEESHLMMALVHLQLAHAYILVEKRKPALNEFRKATVQARAARDDDAPVAIEIEIQALNGEGSILFSMENYAVAGEVYQESAEIADSARQYLSAIDGWLMATFCHEIQGRYVDAYRSCEYVLTAAEKLPKQKRPGGGVAQAGATLLRLNELLKVNGTVILAPETIASSGEVDLRITTLIGENWQRHMPELTKSSNTF